MYSELTLETFITRLRTTNFSAEQQIDKNTTAIYDSSVFLSVLEPVYNDLNILKEIKWNRPLQHNLTIKN